MHRVHLYYYTIFSRTQSLIRCDLCVWRLKLDCLSSFDKMSQQAPSSTTRRVGVALCGFGRAGKIHFHSIRENHRCELKYVVEVAEALGSLRKYLDEYNVSDKTRAVSTDDFEKVHSKL